MAVRAYWKGSLKLSRPRNGQGRENLETVIASVSEAIHGSAKQAWIASSLHSSQ